MATQYPLNQEVFVWTLSAFCQLNRIPFDAALLVKQYPPPHTSIQLEHALQSFGFTTSLKCSQLAQLSTASLPCLAILKPSLQQPNVPTSEAAAEQKTTQPPQYSVVQMSIGIQNFPPIGVQFFPLFSLIERGFYDS